MKIQEVGIWQMRNDVTHRRIDMYNRTDTQLLRNHMPLVTHFILFI